MKILNNKNHIHSPLVQRIEVMVTIPVDSDLLAVELKLCLKDTRTPSRKVKTSYLERHFFHELGFVLHYIVMSIYPWCLKYIWTQISNSLENSIYYTFCAHSVMSDSLWPHGLQPARLFCAWDSTAKNTGVKCHFLLQGIFLTQGSNPCLSCISCIGRQVLYHWCHLGSPTTY